MRKVAVCICILIVQTGLGQLRPSEQVQFDHIRTFALDRYDPDGLSDPFIAQYLNWQFGFLTEGEIAEVPSQTPAESFKKGLYQIWTGDRILAQQVDKASDSIAYSNYLQALTLSEQRDWVIMACEAYKRMLRYHLKNQQDLDTFQKLAKAYEKLAYDDFEKAYATYFLVAVEMGKHYYLNEPQSNIPEKLQLGINKAQAASSEFLRARLTQLLGVHYDLQKVPDLPLKYYEE
ncbi:MAG: hypothetical protein R3359_12225, partial [Marinirhabdus sp.]|nr:hypothetical protein [Marinirhabdus sp.]